MIIRISNVPEGLQPGEFNVRFLRISGDVAMYEFVPEQDVKTEEVQDAV